MVQAVKGSKRGSVVISWWAVHLPLFTQVQGRCCLLTLIAN